MAAMPVRRRGPDAGRDRPADDVVGSTTSPEAALLDAFAALPVGVLICTAGGDRANAALRRIWHAPDDAALDRRVVERTLRLFERRTPLTTRQPGRAPFRPIRGAIEGRAIQPVRAVVDRLDGTVGVVRVAAVPIDATRTAGAIMAVTDETAAHEIERLRDAFLGIVGHELRSPISSILGAAELLHDAGMDPAIRAEIVDDLGDEARRLHDLVEQLIRLADLQRLAIEPTNEPAQLVHVVRRAIRRRHRRQPQLQVQLKLGDEVIPPVIGEDGYIEQ